MSPYTFNDNVTIVTNSKLYTWAKFWSKIQKDYYLDLVYLRREKQIEDFIMLNEFKKVYIIKDTDILKTVDGVVDDPSLADLIVLTDMKFSRYPCEIIIESIEKLLDQCPHLYLCLNRHYININDAYFDQTLSDHFNLAVTQWLKKNLTNVKIIDMSLDYLDRGDHFTWVIPDRMYYIERI